jgi:SAM-dependent methyltransferase
MVTIIAAPPSQHARRCYDALADAYDQLTAGYEYAAWLDRLEALARRHGLRGRRLLDVACGTGKSFMPLLARGYSVTACDISAAMLEHARAKAPHARLLQVDMRGLPRLGEFDLVTCLDDSLNYLLEEAEFVTSLTNVRRNLAAGGVAVWDLNTLAMYGGSFARDQVMEDDGRLLAWRGETSPDMDPAGLAHLSIEVFSERADGLWERATSHHVQRHWPPEAVFDAAAEAGLRILELRGQRQGARLDGALDESVHTKAVYVACRDDRPWEGGGDVVGSP